MILYMGDTRQFNKGFPTYFDLGTVVMKRYSENEEEKLALFIVKELNKLYKIN